MWLRDPLVIEVADNTITPIGLQFWDEAADAELDLSGYSMVMNVATADGQSKLASFDCVIANPTDGGVDIAIDGSAFGEGRGERVFAGQIIATDNNGESVTAARIVILVNEGIE